MRKYIINAFLLFATIAGFSQSETVKWLNIEEAEELMTKEPKKMLIYVHTDWCGYCKLMERKVFNDKDVAKYLNANYYPVKLNAEQKESITFDGYTYEYIREQPRGFNLFAFDLLQGVMAYPGMVLMEEDKDVITVFQGMQDKDLFEKYLEFVNEDAYLTEDWFEYSGQKN